MLFKKKQRNGYFAYMYEQWCLVPSEGLGPPGLELQIVVSHSVNQTWALWKSS